VVTGAGPLKKRYQQRFAEFNILKVNNAVQIDTLWLKIDDYPKMVAAADLGVCMHMSSSNLDLPMKVVDMFSSKLPCFAFDYPTIGELVISAPSPNPNGALFKTAEDLHQLFINHFKDGVRSSISTLGAYRENLDSFIGESWEDHWMEVMMQGQVFRDDFKIKKE
jgi:beta-1,4-mannosyltransferase